MRISSALELISLIGTRVQSYATWGRHEQDMSIRDRSNCPWFYGVYRVYEQNMLDVVLTERYIVELEPSSILSRVFAVASRLYVSSRRTYLEKWLFFIWHLPGEMADEFVVGKLHEWGLGSYVEDFKGMLKNYCVFVRRSECLPCVWLYLSLPCQCTVYNFKVLYSIPYCSLESIMKYDSSDENITSKFTSHLCCIG